MQKLLFLALCGVLAFFQYELWYGKGSIYDSYRLQKVIKKQVDANQDLLDRNNKTQEHLEELKGSPELMEARSRRELGLIKQNEILVNFPTNQMKIESIN